MTTFNDDFGFAYDEAVERPSRAFRLFGRIIDGLRRHHAAQRQLRLLRQLPDRTLIDIGVDPRSVRDDFPSITPAGARSAVVNSMRW